MKLTVEEKLAIHELLGRAAFAFDERQVDLLAHCFAEDASLTMRIAGADLVGPFSGRKAIMALMTGSMNEQSDVRRHVISNIFFEDSGDLPTVISTLTLLATENNETQLLSAGLYRDTVIEEGGHWCLMQRHIELDKSY